MTQRKSTLDILMRDGVAAYMEDVWRQEMTERAQAHFRSVEENQAEIEAMLADDAPEFFIEEIEQYSAPQSQLNPSVGEVISKIASAFDDAFMAFLELSGLTPPTALQGKLASGRRSIYEKVPRSLGEDIRGIGPGKERSNWIPWPPIKSDKTDRTWHFMIDWYGKGPAPDYQPTVHLRIDGVDVEVLKVSKRSIDPQAKRIGFDVHCVDPVGFELEELKSGDLRFNVLTGTENETVVTTDTGLANQRSGTSPVLEWISVMVDTTRKLLVRPQGAPDYGFAAAPRAKLQPKAKPDWRRVDDLPSVSPNLLVFEFWERGRREQEVRIVIGEKLRNAALQQLVMPPLEPGREPTIFPVVPRAEEDEDPRLVVEGLRFRRLEKQLEAISEAKKVGEEEEVARLLPRLGFTAS